MPSLDDMDPPDRATFLYQLWLGVQEEAPLGELALGAIDHQPTPVVHGPWDPSQVSTVLVRWFDAGLLDLFRTGAPLDARSMLSQPERWTEPGADRIDIAPTTKGAHLSPAGWAAVAVRHRDESNGGWRDLHDASLQGIALDWPGRSVRVELGSGDGGVVITGDQVTLLHAPRVEEWGPSSSVFLATEPTDTGAGTRRLVIQMQSGDEVVIEAASFSLAVIDM